MTRAVNLCHHCSQDAAARHQQAARGIQQLSGQMGSMRCSAVDAAGRIGKDSGPSEPVERLRCSLLL